MKTPLERIQSAVAWYNGLKQGYNDIDTLLTASNRLACSIFDFAAEVGDMYQEKNATEFRRKKAFGEALQKALSAQEKQNVSQAREEAEMEVKEQRKAEALADATYYQSKFLLDAAKDVLDRMKQHISNLKQEKSHVMSGTNQ